MTNPIPYHQTYLGIWDSCIAQGMTNQEARDYAESETLRLAKERVAAMYAARKALPPPSDPVTVVGTIESILDPLPAPPPVKTATDLDLLPDDEWKRLLEQGYGRGWDD